MTKINPLRKLKLNKNKKGFSLVELLVAVAIIAIMTPILIEGFTFAAKLNYRSRLQQRADAAANSVYEGIAAVDFEELGDYFSSANGWSAIDDGTGEEYEYYVTKYYDELEDCKINVSVQKYSESYVVPDLNFIGVKSEFLTLAGEINDTDGAIESKIEQGIKSDESVKVAIKQDIITKVKETYGIILTASDIDGARILINCGTVDKNLISKKTSVSLDTEGGTFNADYSVSYRYPAEIPNPQADTASLKVSYSYSHFIDGKWSSVSGVDVDVRGILNEMNYDNNYQFEIQGVSHKVSAKLRGETGSAQTIFIYYNPLSSKDWVNITSDEFSPLHKVFFIEQGAGAEGESTLSLDEANNSSATNNFAYSTVNKALTKDYTTVLQLGGAVDLYSNIKSIAEKGIPDSIYKSSEGQANMYRVNVEVIYQSTLFANVSGSFKAGGGSVGQYSKEP